MSKNQQYTTVDQDLFDPEHKTDGTECPFCHNTELPKITKQSESDIVCTLCGAIFYHPNHYDSKRAGCFTTRYLELPNENMYKSSNLNKTQE